MLVLLFETMSGDQEFLVLGSPVISPKAPRKILTPSLGKRKTPDEKTSGPSSLQPVLLSKGTIRKWSETHPPLSPYTHTHTQTHTHTHTHTQIGGRGGGGVGVSQKMTQDDKGRSGGLGKDDG